MNKLLISLFIATSIFANTTPTPFYSFSLGIASVSYAEAESDIQTENKKTPISGSAMVIGAMVDYTIPLKINQALAIKGTIPLMSSTGRIFSIGSAYQYYFGGKAVSDIEVRNIDGSYIKFSPGFRYYAGATADVSYLYYTSETAKKTDVLFQLGPTGGILYRWKDNIDIKAEADFQIGFGSIVTTTTMKIIGGLTYKF